jgi:hypothetical protein
VLPFTFKGESGACNQARLKRKAEKGRNLFLHLPLAALHLSIEQRVSALSVRELPAQSYKSILNCEYKS